MYSINDKKSAVKEIQKYLYKISDTTYPKIPRIPIDGDFDKETRAAVEKFQQIMGIEVTGIVNNETFALLYDEYLAVIADQNTDNSIIGDDTFPLMEGSHSEAVSALHLIINELGETYTELPSVGTGSFYNKTTSDAIKMLRKIYRLSPSEKVDKILYSRLREDLDARRRVKQKYN